MTASRTHEERREWEVAETMTEHVLERACLALAIAGAAENHRRAEGVTR